MKRIRSLALCPIVAFGALSALACGGQNGASSGSGGTSTTTSQSTGGMGGTTASASGGGGAGGGGSGGGGATGGSGGGGGDIVVGEWTDAPGACPAGMPKVDIDTPAKLASASRGEDAYANDAPATCYYIHDGEYQQSGVIFYVKKGGDAGGARRLFVGQSRKGVVIKGRASIDDGVSDVTLSNMTFDLTGYSDAGSFNTLSLGNGKNVTVDHVTFTGDCATGLKGGHIETNGTSNVLVEACLLEKFGHCGGGGHEDHGIYLASGSQITIRNSVIRQNSSRGIQLYTQGGQYGTLDDITIENNRIEQNGHADYEDGVVINSYGTGTIKAVTIQHNVFANNYYSGIRFAGGLEDNIVVQKNTFVKNGSGSSAAGRSEINIDDAGGGAGTKISSNLFEIGNLLVNNCYDAASKGFGFAADFVHGNVPDGAAGNCVGPETTGDPQLADPASGDYHPKNAAAQSFGAYAP